MPPSSLTARERQPLSARDWTILVALTLACLAVRLWGIGHSLPHTKEADAHIALHVERLRQGLDEPDPNNNDNQYPIVLPALLAMTPSSEAPLEQRTTLQDHLDTAGAAYRETRVEMALFSVLLVPLTFLLARGFVSNGWALFAAALSASSFLTHWFAQQARPHVAASAFMLAAVLAAMRLARGPTLGAYALAAGASALSIGALHNGLATLPPLLVAGVIAPLWVVHEPARRLYLRLAAVPLLLVAIVAVSFRLFYPYLFRESGGTEFDKPLVDGWSLTWGDHRIALADFAGRGSFIVIRTLAYYEPALLVLLVVALGVWIARKTPIYRPYERWSDFWVAAAFAAPYLLAISLFARTFERFVLPLLPYAAAFAAWGLSTFEIRTPRLRWLARAVAAAAIVLGASSVARIGVLRTSPDSLELAANWIASQPDASTSRIYCAPQFDLPLARNAESLQPTDGRPAGRFSRWSVYQSRVGVDVVPPPRFDLRYLTPRPDLDYGFAAMERDPEGYLRALGPGYFVIDASRQPARKVFTELPELLRRIAGEPVQRIGPTEHGRYAGWSLPFEDEILPDWPNVLLRVIEADCTGPVIEIFRVE